jgi:type IV pilus assembly protein PilA
MKLTYLLTRTRNHREIEQGFTLIELLIVILFIGILSTISLPALLSNIGKSRETEATINLGTLSRAQQSYHLENQQFAATLAELTNNIAITSNYYNFPNPTSASNTLVKHQAIASSAGTNQVRNYASGVYFEPNSGAFNIIMCQGQAINSTVDAPNTTSNNCTNGGKKIN